MPFDYTLDFQSVDFRQHPELYRVGRGEQGVLLVQPYKAEILPHWRFKDAAAARESSATIYGLFEAYLKAQDFVGADMARKFIQMGYTRARRYANHAGGKKYTGPVPTDKKGQSGAHGRPELPRNPTPMWIRWKLPPFSNASGTRPKSTRNTGGRRRRLLQRTGSRR